MQPIQECEELIELIELVELIELIEGTLWHKNQDASWKKTLAERMKQYQQYPRGSFFCNTDKTRQRSQKDQLYLCFLIGNGMKLFFLSIPEYFAIERLKAYAQYEIKMKKVNKWKASVCRSVSVCVCEGECGCVGGVWVCVCCLFYIFLFSNAYRNSNFTVFGTLT